MKTLRSVEIVKCSKFCKMSLLLMILIGAGGCVEPGKPVASSRSVSTPPKNVERISDTNATATISTPRQIDQAIEKGIIYLYSKQKGGHWEIAPKFHQSPSDSGGHDFGISNLGDLTAMAVHALLVTGENPNDSLLRPAIELLLKWPLRKNLYGLCQRDLILQLLPQSPIVRSVAFDDGVEIDTSKRNNDEPNGFNIYYPSSDSSYTYGVSQYGVLAMRACSETGFEVPYGYWESTEKVWQHYQDASGGWGYVYVKGLTGEPSISMTAAGVATLLITQDFVHSEEGLFPKGNITNPAIDKGIQWLATNFPSVFTNTSAPSTLYDIERIGLSGGYKYIGIHDWYREGTAWLLQRQNKDGSWGDEKWLDGKNVNNIPATCYALMFLARGRAPVVFNKLQYNIVVDGKPQEAHWNQRPRDIAKISHWIEKMTERDLNWHVVNLKDTPVDELQDAPVIYISGDQKLDLMPEDEAKLKKFVEDGGLILGNPDGNSKAFIDSFQALAKKLFPAYEMRVLPPDHPIYMHEQFRGADIHKKDSLLGLSNGVRELMVMPTTDWGRAWQGDQFAHQDSFRLASNLYLYAVKRASFRHDHAAFAQTSRPALDLGDFANDPTMQSLKPDIEAGLEDYKQRQRDMELLSHIKLEPHPGETRIRQADKAIGRITFEVPANQPSEIYAVVKPAPVPVRTQQAANLLAAQRITLKQVEPLEAIDSYVGPLFTQVSFFCASGSQSDGTPIHVCVFIDPKGKDTIITSPENIIAFIRGHTPETNDADTAYIITKAYLILATALTGKASTADYQVHPQPKSDGFEVYGIAIPADKSGRIAVAFSFVDGKLRTVKEEREVGPERRIQQASY